MQIPLRELQHCNSATARWLNAKKCMLTKKSGGFIRRPQWKCRIFAAAKGKEGTIAQRPPK